MEQMLAFDAIVFPADDRPPHLVALMTTALHGHPHEHGHGHIHGHVHGHIHQPSPPYRCGRMPHPEVFMDYISEGLGPRAWKFHVRISY